MNSFAQRSDAIEIMDDLNCQGEVVHQTLRELEFINRMLGGNDITVSGVKALTSNQSLSNLEIVDLGCGGGDMLILLTKKLSTEDYQLNCLGVDANPNIIAYAKNNAKEYSSIHFEAANILDQEFQSKTFDIAIATLFLHHFTSEQLVAIIKNLHLQCRLGIVINDLHRHPLAFYSIKLLTRLFSKSAMVKFDAPLSVQRGFSRQELEEILNQAGIKRYSLRWGWAFRWKLVIYKS